MTFQTLSEIEITSSRLWIPNTLAWTDIDQVSGSINGLKLKNRDGDVTVSLNSQVSGYEEVIAALGEKRPDLFSIPEFSVLERSPVPTILMIASLIFGVVVLVAVLSGFLVISGNGTPIIVGVLTFIGLFMVAVVLSAPQYISMEDNTLLIKYLLKETSYHADEIASVDLNYQRTRNGRIYFTKLTLKNKKNLTITGMKVGATVTYLVLKEWHKKQTDARFSV